MLYRYIAVAATHYRTVMQVWFGAYVPSQTNVGLKAQLRAPGNKPARGKVL